MDDVEQDLTNVGVKIYRARAFDGIHWVSVVRGAWNGVVVKALRY